MLTKTIHGFTYTLRAKKVPEKQQRGFHNRSFSKIIASFLGKGARIIQKRQYECTFLTCDHKGKVGSTTTLFYYEHKPVSFLLKFVVNLYLSKIQL